MLSTLAVCLLAPLLVLSLRKLAVAFRERDELETQRAVRWATIALALTLCVAFAQGMTVYSQHAQTAPTSSALWEGLRAAKNLCAPPLGVSGAMLYLSRMLRATVRRTQRESV